MHLEELNLTKSLLSKQVRKLNSIASYLAMFPITVPEFLIKEFSKENDLIMDNFSGRGTTGLASRLLNRRFVGNDLNPYAYVLSKFKVSKLNQDAIFKRLDELEKQYQAQQNSFLIEPNNEMLIYYHHNTLKQLLFLRKELGQNWKVNNEIDNAILSYGLGLLHGAFKKNNETIYFSLSMSNSIAMSPNYVKNYSLKNGLIRPDVNVFDKIKSRIKTNWNSLIQQDYEGTVAYCDSTKPLDFIKDNSVDLVITSPPYLNIVNYVNSNWIRLWFLGYERKSLKNEIQLSDKFKYEDYKEFMLSYLNNIYLKLKNKAKVCLVIGDVYEKSLIIDLWNDIKSQVNYQFIKLYNQTINENQKTLRAMNSKKGKATKIERILVLEKVERSN